MSEASEASPEEAEASCLEAKWEACPVEDVEDWEGLADPEEVS